MLISIIGTRASGKSLVEHYLTSIHHFRPVRITEVNNLVHDKYYDEGHNGFENPPALNSRVIEGSDTGTISNGINCTGKVHAPLVFETAFELLEHATKNWRESYVTCDLHTPQLIDLFIKRPFFLLVSIDAPLITRFTRIIKGPAPNLTLKMFVEEHDTLLYRKYQYKSKEKDEMFCSSLHDMFRISNIHVVNGFDSIAGLYEHLNKINLTNPDRLRPQWDTYFMTLAALASQRSNCMKRRVGAILVRDKRIVSTGYNGTPRSVRNCNEGGCRRCNSGGPSGEALDECLCLHAEENALLEAGRDRVGQQAVLYCNTCPCLGCAIKIVQTGVKEVVYNLSYKVDDRTAALFQEAGVLLRQHSPPE